MLMNPDRRMTEEQERLSQRGLSFHENDRLITKPPLLNNDEVDEEEGGNKKTGDNQLLLPAQNIVDRDQSDEDSH